MLFRAAVPYCCATLEGHALAPVSTKWAVLRDCSTCRYRSAEENLTRRIDAWYLNRATTARNDRENQFRSTHAAGFEPVFRQARERPQPSKISRTQVQHDCCTLAYLRHNTVHDAIA
jgi:hypothetical protein